MIENLDSVKKTGVVFSDLENISNNKSDYADSIFTKTIETKYDADELAALEMAFDDAQADDGVIADAWNGLKNFVNLGSRTETCDEAIKNFKKGKISYEEALAEIEKFDEKQAGGVDLLSNITTGVGAIIVGTAAAAAVVASGGTLAPVAVAALAGAGAGAIAKPTVKVLDKATNEVESDINAKDIAKDAISGAISGAIAGATMGNGTAAGSIGASIKTSATRSIKTGLVTGSISGSSGYILDCAFDENKDFNVGELAMNTASSALVSGAVGGIMGTSNGFLKGTKLLQSGGMVKAATDASGKEIVANAATKDIIANSVCNVEYKLVNKGVRETASSLVA